MWNLRSCLKESAVKLKISEKEVLTKLNALALTGDLPKNLEKWRDYLIMESLLENVFDCYNFRGPYAASNWVIPGKLLASAYPTKEDLKDLEKEGIHTIVTLIEEREYSRREDYRSLWLDEGNKLIEKAVPDHGIVSDDTYFKLIFKVLDLLEEGHKIMVHCMGGRGRTGVLVTLIIGYMFRLTPYEALKVTQETYLCRQERGKKISWKRSPETDIQIKQVQEMLDDNNSLSLKRGFEMVGNLKDFFAMGQLLLRGVFGSGGTGLEEGTLESSYRETLEKINKYMFTTSSTNDPEDESFQPMFLDGFLKLSDAQNLIDCFQMNHYHFNYIIQEFSPDGKPGKVLDKHIVFYPKEEDILLQKGDIDNILRQGVAVLPEEVDFILEENPNHPIAQFFKGKDPLVGMIIEDPIGMTIKGKKIWQRRLYDLVLSCLEKPSTL